MKYQLEIQNITKSYGNLKANDDISLNIKPASIDANQDILTLQFKLSPLAWSLAYAFPVHQIGPDFQPQQASEQSTYLLVYRAVADDITFLELNPVSARLIDLLNEGLTGLAAAKQITEELQHPNPEIVIDGARSLINKWLSKAILISR